MRARALLMLAEGAHIETAADYERHLDLALAEAADDPGLHAWALATKATNTTAAAVSRIAEAERWALQALPYVARTGPEVERRVLYALGWARALRGGSIDELCERFRDASDAAFYIVHSPVRVARRRLVWRGQVKEARATLAGLLALADERGEPASYALARLHLCELELRAGEWDAASRRLDEWADSAERELLPFPMYERCHALLAAGRGVPAEAERWAASAASRAEAIGARWDWLEALRARGTAALLADDPASASESLRAVWAHCRREGVDDPGVFPVAPELVEALVELAELDEARAVTDRLAEPAEQQEHPWGLASAKRCGALLALASRREDDSAVVALGEAAQAYERWGCGLTPRARS